MKKLILIFVSVGTLLLQGCGGSNASVSADIPKTPEELRAELANQEKANPLSYLTVEATMNEDQVQTRSEGLFHSAEYAPDGNTIHGKIKNSATVAKFKDVVVTITFYSQTDTPVESKDTIIYEFFEPNSIKEFTLKVYPPETMKKFGVEVKGATAVN